MEEEKKDALHFLMSLPGKHKRGTAPDAPTQTGRGRNGGKKRVKPVVFLLVVGTAVAVAMTWRGTRAEVTIARVQSRNTASAERRDISSELPSLDTLKAKGTYSIISMVEGEVLSASLEKEDQVERDQMLYEVDRSNMEPRLTSSVNSLTRSQSSYEDALEGYNDALSGYSGNTYKATDTGYIEELYISVGDKVSGNTELADVYSGDTMETEIPFLSGEVAVIGADIPAVITLVDTGGQMVGTAKAVVNQETVPTGGRLVRVVTVRVPNPGGLTTFSKAMAQIGEFISSEDEVFEASMDTTVSANLSTSVEVKFLLVNVGDYATKETPVSKMTDRSADKLAQDYEDALDRAEESVEPAQSGLGSTQDSYDNYTIKAPISGQVITKNSKAGDNIIRNSSSTTALAIIYDLPSLTFGTSIDELNIKRVKVGQEVEVSADTFEGQTFSSAVTNVSLESTYSNGVSTYPVTVILNDISDLLPGMSIDGVATLEGVDDMLAIPADALMRENRVYVKNDAVTKRQGPVPAEFRAVKMETGLTSDTFMEIRSGLSEEDVVHVVEPSKNSSGIMMIMGGGMDSPPEGGRNIGGGNRGGSEGGRQNR